MLLEGPHLEHEDHRDLFQIAQQLYDSLVTGKKFQLHHKIMIEGAWVPTHSRIAIDKLSTLVTDKYKSDFFRIQKTEAGRHKLVDVQNDFLTDFAELNRILDADPDNIEVFCGIGDRVFPDGMVKETAHAFLLGKQQDREIVVYDPNDPGKPIECKISNTQGAIAIEWTCRYRRTGKITTQQYRIVPKDQFFRVFAEQR